MQTDKQRKKMIDEANEASKKKESDKGGLLGFLKDKFGSKEEKKGKVEANIRGTKIYKDRGVVKKDSGYSGINKMLKKKK